MGFEFDEPNEYALSNGRKEQIHKCLYSVYTDL